MKPKNLLGTGLIFIALASMMAPSLAADTLVASDFEKESWDKTIDYFDYVRSYASDHNIALPPNFANWHAYIYMVYINVRGLRMLYAGLINITFGGFGTFTLPLQSVMMHYRSENRSRDVVMASNFLMLMAFNDTTASLYPDSPDMNDELWASYSIGFNFATYFPNITLPSLNSRTSVIHLSSSNDKLQWSWGMKYANLTSIWWRTFISPTNHTYASRPIALATYEELAFSYNLTISPDTGKATLAENHNIGRIRNLWIFWGWFIIPLYTQYNSTGCYAYSLKLSNETVHDFMQNHQIKMSIIDFQTSTMFDRKTYSRTANGQNVTDSDRIIDDSTISTYTDDGEKIFDASFGAKRAYRLYDNASDPTSFHTYNSTTRTTKISVFAENTNAETHARLFESHTNFMKFLPYLVTHMNSQLYDRAKDTITNMTRANYFYIVAYPNYGGYRVEHDPILTVYLTTSALPDENQPFVGTLLIAAAVISVVVLILIVVFMIRRKPKQPPSEPSQ